MLRRRTCFVSLFLVLLAPAAKAALDTACYRIVDSQESAWDLIPCGVVTADSGNVACCNPGSFCLQDGICLTPGTPPFGFTGYYTAGCTDPKYQDPSCNPYCRTEFRQDIVYDNTTQTWACCGTESDNTTVNCNSPTNLIFDDPAPSLLSTTFSVGSAAVTATSSSSSSSSNSTQTTSPTSSISETKSSALPSQTGTSQPVASSGLSTGAKAGIGIGVAIVLIAVLVGAILFLRRRQRNIRNLGARELAADKGLESNAELQELEAKQKRAELNAEPEILVHEI